MGIHNKQASTQITTSIKQLREKIKRDPNLIKDNAPTDEETLLRFLNVTDFNIDESLKKIKHFYSKRSELVNWFRTKDSKMTEEKLELGQFIPLPGTDIKGRKILLLRKAECSLTDQDQFLKTQCMILDLMVMDPVTQSHGVVLLVDHNKFSSSLSFLTELAEDENPANLSSWKDAYPMKNETIYVFRASKEFEAILNVKKTIMNERFKQELILLGSDVQKLQEHFSDSVLPVEYGGKAGTLQKIIDDWIYKIKCHKNKRSTEDGPWPWVEERKRASSFSNKREANPYLSNPTKLVEIEPEKD